MSAAIRPMASGDLDAVIQLAAGCAGAPQWNRDAYQAILSPAGAVQRFAFVDRSEQQFAGFAITSWLPPEAEAELETVVVDIRHRRRGVASRLLRACISAASQAGAAGMRLEVRASNAAALALYQKHRFAIIGTRRSYYSSPVEDAVLLRLPLPE